MHKTTRSSTRLANKRKEVEEVEEKAEIKENKTQTKRNKTAKKATQVIQQEQEEEPKPKQEQEQEEKKEQPKQEQEQEEKPKQPEIVNLPFASNSTTTTAAAAPSVVSRSTSSIRRSNSIKRSPSKIARSNSIKASIAANMSQPRENQTLPTKETDKARIIAAQAWLDDADCNTMGFQYSHWDEKSNSGVFKSPFTAADFDDFDDDDAAPSFSILFSHTMEFKTDSVSMQQHQSKINDFLQTESSHTIEELLSFITSQLSDNSNVDVDGWDDDTKEVQDGDQTPDADWGDLVEDDGFNTNATKKEKDTTNEEKIGDMPALSRQKSYKIMMSEDLARLQRAMIERVAASLGITISSAGILLRFYHWNEQEAFNQFKIDAKQAATQAGIQHTMRSVIQPPDTTQGQFQCMVCFDDVAMSETFSMPCEHRFCLGCYRNHLQSAIEGGVAAGGNCLYTTCPGYKCKQVIGEEVFEMLLEPATFEKYKNVLLHSFVNDNNALVWCPAPKCGRVIAFSQRQSTVVCTCGQKFCFKCKETAHAPCTCSEYQDWRSRDKGSLNLDNKFILESTKPCPGCGVRVKKDGGCMYMVCSNCKKNWCWQCGKSDHHVWECNRPPYEILLQASNDHNRYLFYYERFFNHQQSLKISEKQILAVNSKMKELVQKGMHFKRVDFLRRAVELVIESRRVLSWTYSHAFYIKNKSERDLFEYKQSELEKYTEKLNQLTEGQPEELESRRLEVLDWTRALDKYLTSMEHTGESEFESALASVHPKSENENSDYTPAPVITNAATSE